MNVDEAEVIRKKYKLRKRILRGRIQIPLTLARRLIGPDCAYHLYSLIKNTHTGPL